MEFIISTDLAVIPQKIEFNFEEIKAEIAPKLDYYTNLVVTEDSIKAAKADKANLNKLKTAIDDKRKEIKKACLAPYEAFEKQCKEITAMIDKPIAAIDTQLKGFDEEKQNQKYSLLKVHFGVLKFPEYVTLDAVINPKWRNATLTYETLKKELELKKNEIDNALIALDVWKDKPFYSAIIADFKKHLELSKSLVYASQIQREYERQEVEKAKKQQEEAQVQPENAQNEQEQPPKVEVGKQQPEAQTAPVKRYKGKFEVSATAEQLKALCAYMKSNGIEYKTLK